MLEKIHSPIAKFITSHCHSKLERRNCSKQVKNFKVRGQFEKINLQVPVKQFFVLIVATSSAELDLFERDEI